MYPYVMEKKTLHLHAGLYRELKSRLKNKGDVMIKRHTHLLNEFSRKKSEAKLIQQLQRSVKAVDANANGTSGYTIKEGKNAGTVLKHLKKDSKKI